MPIPLPIVMGICGTLKWHVFLKKYFICFAIASLCDKRAVPALNMRECQLVCQLVEKKNTWMHKLIYKFVTLSTVIMC